MASENKHTSSETARYSILRNAARVVALAYRAYPTMLVGVAIIFVFTSILTFSDAGIRALLINELVEVAGTSVWTDTLLGLLAAYIILRLLPDMMHKLRDYWAFKLWCSLESEFNKIVFKKKGELDIATHEDPAHNNLFNRVNENGVWRMTNFLDRMFFLIENILEMVIAGIILLSFKWWLLLVLAVSLIPRLIVEIKYGSSSYGLDVETSQVRREYNMMKSHFTNLGDIVEVKLMGLARGFINQLKVLYDIFRGQQVDVERKKYVWGSAAGVLTQLAIALAFGWGINEVLNGNMQIGTLTFLFSTTVSFNLALGGLFMNLGVEYKDNLYVSDIFTLLDLKPKIESNRESSWVSADRTPKIEFKDVSFAYPGGENEVLKHINLTIEPGQKLALIGINGAGKTTLIKLLCRFYDPTDGVILVDGKDLREINIESWHALLGALFQDYSRYKFAVDEAISVSLPESSLDEKRVEKSAKNAEADLFINEWARSYKQRLGKQFEGGVEPSIGQWQKLALARTFYRDPRILILDEPTSSIDAEAEAKIFDKLEKLPSDRTVILISHRFSTVRHASKIVVIENGTISEEGPHEELLSQNKTYARLFKLQAKGYA